MRKSSLDAGRVKRRYGGASDAMVSGSRSRTRSHTPSRSRPTPRALPFVITLVSCVAYRSVQEGFSPASSVLSPRPRSRSRPRAPPNPGSAPSRCHSIKLRKASRRRPSRRWLPALPPAARPRRRPPLERAARPVPSRRRPVPRPTRLSAAAAAASPTAIAYLPNAVTRKAARRGASRRLAPVRSAR